MATELTPEQWTAIESHLYAGEKIAAIKLYREATGMGLKESKELLESHEAGLRAQFPERFKAGKAGCGAAVLVGLLVTGATVTALVTTLS